MLLFDVPGPRARARHRVYTVVTLLVLVALLGYVGYVLNGSTMRPFNPEGEWTAQKWTPLFTAASWQHYIIPGLINTLMAAGQAAVAAVVFGMLFGVGRMSDHKWISWPCAVVVEFFRGIPLLMLIFFTVAFPLVLAQLAEAVPALAAIGLADVDITVDTLTAVVVGLTLYNGSVLAEVFRAGIQAVPKGQSEAAYSLGMGKTQVMTLILLPQAVASMMPAIVAQLVVLLKDTALGYIVAYPELLRNFRFISTEHNNIIPAAIVCAAIYIAINMALSRFAIWLERRNARRGKASATVVGAPGMDPASVGALGAAGEPGAAPAATAAPAGTTPEPTLRGEPDDGPGEPGDGAEGPDEPGTGPADRG
ncbi:amino acid ABC transporter membrane protein 2 (PAAT family) [Murinocardiopsis flavida]|uniref:Amino acid ABC transporter membrane protein 2 (PAAT family) n=2 Tax=Murinocardiopsis flavida TaxID=645275 RepID=A0A2P8DUU3_9ACTN|nr:amino acid ABC transporter membrane protein 2 (PAAT family) [Murinocardiopsis flavida]